jgi:carbon dioxide concentrating mechanism protein CcmO
MPAAFGFVETRGFTGMIEATDAMLKEARVDLVRQEHIGGGHATAIVRGDVGAVRASVEAGATASKAVGEFHAATVIPNLSAMAETVIIDWKGPGEDVAATDSIGMIEMHGFAPMIEAADAAVKAARVTLVDYVSIGGGRCAAIVRGDVAACRTAVDAGEAAGSRVGPLVAKHVIPSPHALLQANGMPLGATTKKEKTNGKALGIIETQGFVASVEALDAAVKTAQVVPVGWQRVGSGYSAVVVMGDVAAARSAVDSGGEAASRVGKLSFTHVIPRPHEGVGQVLPPGKKH